MFWGRKEKINNSIIMTTVTKTSNEAQREKEISAKALLRAKTCPKCGYMHEDLCTTFPTRYEGTNTYVLHSKCVGCETEWKVEYKL